MHSPDPLALLCLIPLRGPTSPSTHSVSVLSPKLGAPSSVTIHVPRPTAQTRRTAFPKEGGGRWGSSLLWWGSSLLFLQRTGGIGVCCCYRISRRVSGGIFQAHGSKQLPGFEEGSEGSWGLDPHQQQRVFYLPKVFPFPVGRRNIRLRNISAPSPAHT